MSSFAQLYWHETEEAEEEYKRELAPVVIFAYKRLDHIKAVIETLQNNEYAEDTKVFIFSDGSKGYEDEEAVKAVRQYLNAVTGFKTVKLIERQQNYGLAKNIISGVTKVVNKYGKVIVLEDDIVTSKFFLRYMNDALKAYENNPEVMEISGMSYPFDKTGLPETMFLHWSDCWGWATWSRAWKYFKRKPWKVLMQFSPRDIYHFNFEGKSDFFRQIIYNCVGIQNTWAIFWQAAIFKRNGLMLFPKDSLVCNIGMDASGEHNAKADPYKDVFSIRPVRDFSYDITESTIVRRRLADFLNETDSVVEDKFFNKILRRIKKSHLFKRRNKRDV